MCCTQLLSGSERVNLSVANCSMIYSTKKVELLPAIVTGADTKQQVLVVPKLVSGTGHTQADAV